MAEHNIVGNIGEEVACEMMRKKGFRIVETNWRFGHLEMDIDRIEYDRLYNRYRYFLEDEKADVKVFSQDFTDKSNALFYFRKLFANEFSKYFV